MAETKAVLFEDGKFQGMGNNGQVVPYGKLYFYDAVSGDKVNTFTTSTMETQNTYPIVLSASGKADVYVTDGQFDVTLLDKNGTNVWTINNFIPAGGSIPIAPTYTEIIREDKTGTVGTTLVLDDTPVTDVTVHKNGLILNEDEYSLSGNVITFVTPLIITDEIVVEFGKVVLGTNKALMYSIDTMADILIADITDLRTTNVEGYFESGDGGGGVFNYIATVDKATANRGTIIDPDQTLANQGSGTGQGCWIRQYSGVVNALWFGVDPSETEANQVIALDYMLANTTNVYEYFIPHVINYGLDNRHAGTQISDLLTLPNKDGVIEDNSVDNGYTSPAHQGGQTRTFYLMEDATTGQHNGFNYLSAEHHIGDMYLLEGDGIFATDQLVRNATNFYGTNGVAFWGVGMGGRTVTVADPNNITDAEQLQATNFKIVANELRGTSTITNVMNISRTTANVGWFAPIEPSTKYHFGIVEEDVNQAFLIQTYKDDLSYPEFIVGNKVGDQWKTTYADNTSIQFSSLGQITKTFDSNTADSYLNISGHYDTTSLYVVQKDGKKCQIQVKADGSTSIFTSAGERVIIKEGGNVLAVQGVSGNATTTAARPSANLLSNGTMMFDSDLGIPIWLPLNTSNTWVDATGAVV